MNQPRSTRMNPLDRKDEILQAATAIANEGNLYTMTAVDVGKRAACARSLIHQYYGPIGILRNYVILKALHETLPNILAQALAKNDALIRDMSDKQRDAVAQFMTGD